MLFLVCLFPRALLDSDVDVADKLFNEKSRMRNSSASKLKKRGHRESRQDARAHKYLLGRLRDGAIEISPPSDFRHQLHLDPEDATIQLGLIHTRESMRVDRKMAPRSVVISAPLSNPSLHSDDDSPTYEDFNGHSDDPDITLTGHTAQSESEEEGSDEAWTLHEIAELKPALEDASPIRPSVRRSLSVRRKPVPVLDMDLSAELEQLSSSVKTHELHLHELEVAPMSN